MSSPTQLTKEKLQKLQELLKLTSEGLSVVEFQKAFAVLTEYVKKVKDKNETEFKKISEEFKQLFNEFQDRYEDIEKNIAARLANVKDGKIGEKGEKGDPGNDGISPDPQEVALEASKMARSELESLIPNIDAIIQEMPKAGASVASALELLPDSEKLSIEAIQDLRKELDELRQIKGQRLGGGGFSKIAWLQYVIDNESPSGTPNGVLTDFTLANNPSSGTLKVYVNGQRMKLTDDYTLSGNTISFVTAPPTGSLILCDYKT